MTEPNKLLLQLSWIDGTDYMNREVSWQGCEVPGYRFVALVLVLTSPCCHFEGFKLT
jgi:hypothetical protein